MFGGKKNKNTKAQESVPSTKPVQGLDDFVIRVMPESFVGRRSELTEKTKPLPVPAPKPLPKPITKPAPLPKPIVKQKSNTTGVLVIVGILVVISFGLAGYLVIRSLDQPESIVVEPVVETPIIKDVPTEPVPGTDTDSDGLTDVEETLYGTNVRNPDSDGDTFLDGNEVFHRYSPLGNAPSTLLDTGAVELFTDDGGEFTFTYPSEWTVSSSIDDNGITEEVIVGTDTLAVFVINYSVIDENSNFEDWYGDNGDPTLRFTGLQETLTKEGYSAYIGSDDRIAYLLIDSTVYTFEYDLGSELSVDYLQTFQMMLNSFLVLND